MIEPRPENIDRIPVIPSIEVIGSRIQTDICHAHFLTFDKPYPFAIRVIKRIENRKHFQFFVFANANNPHITDRK